MKYFAIFLISIYQLFFSPFLKSLLGVQKMCRYSPSCSEYAKVQLWEYGLIKGGYFALRRILSCQPFVKHTNFTV